MLHTLRFRFLLTFINFVFHALQGGKYNRTSVMRYLTTLMHLITRQCTYLETSCQDLEIDGDVEFLILASDGLWDVVPNEVSMPYTKFGTRICVISFE